MIIEAVTLSLEHFITISLIYPSASGRFYLISAAKIAQIGLKITIFVKNGRPMSIICRQTWFEWLLRLLRYSKYSL